MQTSVLTDLSYGDCNTRHIAHCQANQSIAEMSGTLSLTIDKRCYCKDEQEKVLPVWSELGKWVGMCFFQGSRFTGGRDFVCFHIGRLDKGRIGRWGGVLRLFLCHGVW